MATPPPADAYDHALLADIPARTRWPGTHPAVPICAAGRRVIIFGDVHLTPDRPAAWQVFIDFLARLQPDTTAAAICLGDLFEFYFGEPQLAGPEGEGLAAFADVRRRGIPIAFVPGNRDFLAGPCFERRGVPVVRDWLRLRLDDDPREIHICHGDNLVHTDHFYQAFRRVMHSAFVRTGAAMLPGTWRLAIARWLRADSQHRHARRARRQAARLRHPQDSPPTGRPRRVPTAVADALLAMPDGPRAIVAGHFHVPALQPGANGVLLTVGDWREDGGVVAVAEGGVVRLVHSREF